MLTEWTKEVFSSDDRVNKLEKIITVLFYIVNQLLRSIQILVPLELGFRVILMAIQNEKWTYMKEKSSSTCYYCPRNFVHTGQMFFGFHVFLAVFTLIMWVAMWREDSVDDEMDREEESEWQKKEEKFGKTVQGKSMNFVLMLGGQGLFGKEVATAMITFSVAAAH